MPKFTLNAGDPAGHVFPPVNPVPGAHLLVVERELLDPTTDQTVGTLLGAFTFMKIIPPDDALVLGIVQHHLNASVKPPAQAGVISVQGSIRFSQDLRVFSIVGGTGHYRDARGTVTLEVSGRQEKFHYDVN
jgi:hypothetical protein